MQCCGQEMRVIYADGCIYLWCLVCDKSRIVTKQELEKEKQDVENNLVHDFS